jgi:hypothetical protein
VLGIPEPKLIMGAKKKICREVKKYVNNDARHTKKKKIRNDINPFYKPSMQKLERQQAKPYWKFSLCYITLMSHTYIRKFLA